MTIEVDPYDLTDEQSDEVTRLALRDEVARHYDPDAFEERRFTHADTASGRVGEIQWAMRRKLALDAADRLMPWLEQHDRWTLAEAAAETGSSEVIETCPACKGQTGPEFTCSICAGTNVYPADSLFRLDSLALAAQAGYDYNGAPDGFVPMYATTDMSGEADNFWNSCRNRTQRADRLMDELFGPEDEARS